MQEIDTGAGEAAGQTHSPETTALWAQLDVAEKQQAAAEAVRDGGIAAPSADGMVMPETAPDAAPPSPDDIWQGLSDSQRAALEQLRAERVRYEQDARAWRGRTPQVQSENDRLRRELAQYKNAASAPKRVPNDVTDADWNQFAADYPDLARAIEKRFQRETEPVKRLEREIENDRVQRHTEYAISELQSEHPDWYEIKESQVFTNWLSSQPPSVQAIVSDSRDPKDAAFVLRQFKTELRPQGQMAYPHGGPQGYPPAAQYPNSHQTALSERRRRQMESAASPRATTPLPAMNGVPDEPEAAWRAFDRMGL